MQATKTDGSSFWAVFLTRTDIFGEEALGQMVTNTKADCAQTGHGRSNGGRADACEAPLTRLGSRNRYSRTKPLAGTTGVPHPGMASPCVHVGADSQIAPLEASPALCLGEG